MASEPEGATPPNVDDHVFRPRGQWWSLCAVCGLSGPAHKFVCDLCQGRADDTACVQCGQFQGVPA